jgi:hypothetical protein
MKFRYNKKRNTAFIYEVLIVEFSKASMSSNESKKNKLVGLLKEHFSKKSLLKKDLEIYKSFDNTSDLDENTMEKLIQEAKNQFNLLDRKKIFSQQTYLINEINKNFGSSAWDRFVLNYKKLATINQALNRTLAPKKQILVEKKLINLLTQQDPEKKPFPNINNLAVKTFVKKFNEEYDQLLEHEQKKLLEKYITSYNDDGLEFKMYFYEEIDRLKSLLNKKINKDDALSSGKLQKVVDRISDYNDRVLDRTLITEVMQIQSLVKEINQ